MRVIFYVQLKFKNVKFFATGFRVNGNVKDFAIFVGHLDDFVAVDTFALTA